MTTYPNDETDARRIAGEWHDGQASALYAFCSTGTVRAELLDEIERATEDAQTSFDPAKATTGETELDALRAWLIANRAADLLKIATDHARERGAEDGRDAATWVFDGNTDRATYRRVLDGIDDGDPEILDALPMPDLSGEWADRMTGPQLVTDALWVGAGVREEEGSELIADGFDDICTAYEDAFCAASAAEVERVAREMLADEE